MSKAFVKEDSESAAEVLPDREMSPHANLVTEEGLAQIEAPTDCGGLLSFLSKAGQAAQHAAHLSSQLLTFSKGGAPLKKVVSISRLLEEAAEFSLYGSNLRADFNIASSRFPAA